MNLSWCYSSQLLKLGAVTLSIMRSVSPLTSPLADHFLQVGYIHMMSLTVHFFFFLSVLFMSALIQSLPQVWSPPSIPHLLALLCKLSQESHLVFSASSGTLCDLPFLWLPFPCSLLSWKMSLCFFRHEYMHCICPPGCLLNIIFTTMVKSQE